MAVLLTGATGYIGSALLPRLLENEHPVTALVPTEKDADAIRQAGATPLIGDTMDSETIAAAALDSDGVIHLDSAENDGTFIDAVLRGLEGSDKPFIYTGSIWTYGSNGDITETSTPNPPSIAAWLVPNEKRLLGEEGVHTTIVVPGIVYGHGGGLPTLILDAIDSTVEPAAIQLVGDGSQHWATVHIDDLTDLYLQVLENGLADQIYIAANGSNPTVKQIGAAAADARHLTGGTVTEPNADTAKRLGWDLTQALLLDQQAHGVKARKDLGWSPDRPTLLDVIANGYRTGP